MIGCTEVGFPRIRLGGSRDLGVYIPLEAKCTFCGYYLWRMRTYDDFDARTMHLRRYYAVSRE